MVTSACDDMNEARQSEALKHAGEGQHGVDVNMVSRACVGRMVALSCGESERSLASSPALCIYLLLLYGAERSFKRSRRSCLSRCTWPLCCST